MNLTLCYLVNRAFMWLKDKRSQVLTEFGKGCRDPLAERINRAIHLMKEDTILKLNANQSSKQQRIPAQKQCHHAN